MKLVIFFAVFIGTSFLLNVIAALAIGDCTPALFVTTVVASAAAFVASFAYKRKNAKSDKNE